jgi:hypothetical protein
VHSDLSGNCGGFYEDTVSATRRFDFGILFLAIMNYAA